MERKVVQDIVPASKRTIRSLPPKKRVLVDEEDGEEIVPIRRAPSHMSLERAQARTETPVRQSRPVRHRIEESEEIEMPSHRTPPKKRRFGSVLFTFLIIFVSIAVIAVALSLLYSKAAVTITPKTAHIDINGTFTAKREGDPSVSSESIVYSTVTASSTASQSVPATAGQMITSKAKGTVTLYNEQTTQQKIVPGTRLANADGEVYRTTATVVIPAGKPGAPGKIDTAVIADAAGADYNMSLTGSTELKIVAYKDTPKYTTVYAKIKTAITGGYAGQKTSVSQDVQKATVAALEDSLTTKLLADAKNKMGPDQILYGTAYTIDFDTPEPVAKDANNAVITVNGVLSASVFKKDSLLKSIAAKELDKFPAPSYDIQGLDDLRFSVVNSKDFAPRKGSPLIFSLKGPVNLVGTISEVALKNDLKGTYLKDSNTIFAKYPSIANAYALITPFWMRSFPNSADKIIIEVKK